MERWAAEAVAAGVEELGAAAEGVVGATRWGGGAGVAGVVPVAFFVVVGHCWRGGSGAISECHLGLDSLGLFGTRAGPAVRTESEGVLVVQRVSSKLVGLFVRL